MAPRTGSAGRRSVIVPTLLSVMATVGIVGATWAAGVDVRATLDRNRIRLGEQAVLTVEVDGAQNTTPPVFGDIEGLSIDYLGPATQVSIVNGRVSQGVNHRYTVTGQKAGRFTVAPVTVQVRGQTYRTQPLVLEVTQAPRGRRPGARVGGKQGEPDLSLVLEVPRREFYVRERIPVTLTLYLGATQVDDVQQPRIEGDAFSVEPFGKPVQSRARIEGRRYRTVRFDTTAVPLRAGTLTVGPAVQPMSILVSRSRRDPFFDRFFGADLFAERRPFTLRSNAEVLTVRRLPKEGRPAGFNGAVGQFDLQVSAQPRNLRANDPVTLTMRITGSGYLAGVAAPEVAGSGFKTYPVQTVKSEEGVGVLVFEQVLIPIDENVREIPEIQFAYFDPAAGAYRVATAGPIALVVRPPQRLEAAPAVTQGGAAGADVGDRETLGQDIVYIKDRPGRMARGAPLHRRTGFLAAQALPLGLYMLTLVVVRRRNRLHGDPRYARFIQAGREARRAIAVARRRAADGQAADVYDDVARAVREYLSAKLDVPVGAVDPERVADRLGDADAPVVRRVDEFFTLVEGLRYAPNASGDGDGRAVLELAEGIVRGLERQRRLGERFQGGGWLGVLAMTGCLWAAVAAAAGDGAERDPVTSFFEANAFYKAGNYEAAAARYEALRASGFHSGALHYNLGNAYFKAGDLGRAILNYERARRLLPRDPDVRANLRFARQQVKGSAAVAVPGPPLWIRLLVPLASRATTSALAAAASAAYTVTLMLLTVRVCVPRWRVMLGRAALAAGAVLVLAGSACAVRIWQEELRTMAVVVDGTDVPVRFEPADDGTVHFTVPEGLVVRVLGHREGWDQIARGDDRRGWIAADAVEPL